MFERLGRLVYRRRIAVLVLAAFFVVFAITWGTKVFSSLSDGGFDDPRSESSKALATIDQQLGQDRADIVVIYSSPRLTVDDPAFRDSVQSTLAGLPTADVGRITSYWSTGQAPQLVSRDRHTTYAVLHLANDASGGSDAAYKRIADDLKAPGLTTLRGGNIAINSEITTQVKEDIGKAESLSLPILMVLLVLVFGSLAAASLPLAIGGLAILGAFTLLRVLTLFGDVSVFAINIVTMMGLGLAIDYALFVVSRFREELKAAGGTRDGVEVALARTMATAGRTVAFSGVTVAVSLAALLFFPQNFLRSMGFGGMAAVFVDVVAALTVLPALLAVLGPRVDALRVRVPWRHKQSQASSAESGLWARWARGVMRRPIAVIAATVTLLILLGLPFLHIQFGGIDTRVLPAGSEGRTASETLQREFPGNSTDPIDVVVSGATPAQLQTYVSELARTPGAVGTQIVGHAGDTTHVAVTYKGEAISTGARELVDRIRAVPAPQGAEVLVGGQSAALTDLLDGLASRLPIAAGFVVVVTFVLLFLAFGSLVLPAKALVMNVLSLSAMLGVVTWIFQEGHFANLLHFTSTGTVEATQPVLMLALAFGLSMDYEVFLLSRIREEWDRTHDNALAVERGLQRTGRIITSAALLLVVVIGAFSTSGITFIKMIGLGMIVAILVDATIVRALLVPATMKVLGGLNWCAPAPLARWWERHGFREHLETRDEPRELVSV